MYVDGGWRTGAEGDRTLDLRIANATLSQLSYRPTAARDSSIVIPQLQWGFNGTRRCGYDRP
jgi:hypothetical protein